MAQQTTLMAAGLPGQVYSFSAKTEAGAVHADRIFSITSESRTLSVDSESRTLAIPSDTRIQAVE